MKANSTGEKGTVMGIPWTGSQGVTRDLWALCHAACYEPDPVYGHDVQPPDAVRDLLRYVDKGSDEERAARYDAEERVPFSPKCAQCRKAAKRVMERRGLSREQIRRLFDRLGAKWDWTSRESDEKRRLDDKGVMVVTATGELSTDEKQRAKARRDARRVVQHDQKQDNKERRARRAAATRS